MQAAWNELASCELDAVLVREAVEPRPDAWHHGLIFPGSFNPFHRGHARMAQFAMKRLGKPVELELSIANVDKSTLTPEEFMARMATMPDSLGVWLTRSATFVDKSQLFPNATFVVGADTIRRVAQPRYYGNDEGKLLDAIERIRAQNCRFLVFGRVEGPSFQTLASLRLLESLRELCDEIPEQEFRVDICSTDLRNQSG